MKINKENALKLWEKRYGQQTRLSDFADYLMDKSAYNNPNSEYGWNLHHKQPIAKGGSDDELNLEITSIYVNSEISDRTSFVIDDVEYEVQRVQKPEYGIFMKQTKQRVDWHQ